MISLFIFCSATGKLFFGGTANPNFMLGDNDKAPVPIFHIFDLKNGANPIQKSNPARLTQPNQQNSFVSSRREAANIREIEILSDQEALRSLRGLPNTCIILSNQSLLGNRVRFVTQLRQNLN